MDNRILLIRTGGTIDSEAYADPKAPPEFVKTLKGDQSLILRAMANLPNYESVDGFSWVARQEDRFVKDSKEFTDSDLNSLAQIIKDDSRRYFIITHGTDFMAKNAAALQEKLQGIDKTVVFTGSMVPLSMRDKHESDALPALAFTLDRIGSQPPGVSIVGRDATSQRLAFFNPSMVEKDRDASRDNLQFTLKSR